MKKKRFLTGIQIESQKEALEATDALHLKGVETIIVTSLFYGPKDKILVIGSTKGNENSFSISNLKISF